MHIQLELLKKIFLTRKKTSDRWGGHFWNFCWCVFLLIFFVFLFWLLSVAVFVFNDSKFSGVLSLYVHKLALMCTCIIFYVRFVSFFFCFWNIVFILIFFRSFFMDFLVINTTTITKNYHYHDHWLSSLIFLCLDLFSSQTYEGHEHWLYYRAVFFLFSFCIVNVIKVYKRFCKICFYFKIFNRYYCKYFSKILTVLINCCRLSSCPLMYMVVVNFLKVECLDFVS